MANPEHVEIVKRGADFVRQFRASNPYARLYVRSANLSGEKLAGADLSDADLKWADLSNADLSHADLRRAKLLEANLSGAKLTGANLRAAKVDGASLNDVELVDADLSDASLKHADFRGADLTRANLRLARLFGARFGRTVLVDLDLSTACDLSEARHAGPSTIDVDTLYKSKGMISEAFLRGCGVPDGLIANLPSLLGSQQAIQFYSCFISYSHNDEELVNRLCSRMRDEGLRVWYAPEDMKGGRKIHEQIDEAIRMHDKLLLVLSEHSMASEWVATEIYHARQREVNEKKRVLFPIRLVPFEVIRDWKCFDADSGKDMGREIREYFIPDFSNWKDHDAFEAGFKRLLDDLKTEAERNASGSGGEHT